MDTSDLTTSGLIYASSSSAKPCEVGRCTSQGHTKISSVRLTVTGRRAPETLDACKACADHVVSNYLNVRRTGADADAARAGSRYADLPELLMDQSKEVQLDAVLVESLEEFTIAELSDRLSLLPRRVRLLCLELESRGLLVRNPRGERASKAVWHYPDDPEDPNA